MRAAIVALVAGGVLLLGAAPAAPPDYPVNFISVDALKAALDRGAPAFIVDVRSPDEFRELHIKGARSIPLRTMEARAGEVPRSGLVVLY